MLTTGSLVTSATALRVTVRSSELWMQKAPHLAQLAMTAWVGGPGGARAQAAFRDDVLSLAREAADVSWREVRRGLDDFDARTRPRKKAPTARPYRPYRVKL
jgi:hypothetical protein